MTKSVAVLLFCFASLFSTATSSLSPVLVELFTSEGCSSCPPADALLQDFDRSQSIAGAQLIVLSEHVNYWNHLGWADPYSSNQATDRQGAYVRHFGLDGSYTPQMVVDGASEFVGSDSGRARQALVKARTEPKVTVRVSPVSSSDSNTLNTRVEVDALPDSFKMGTAEVYVVAALHRAESEVERGENGGRHLSHVNVARSMSRIGTVEKRKSFAADVRMKLPAGAELANIRVIAFVQQPGPGKILGAGMSR